ncbi:hypothetical protein FA15DRAFT_600129, partial [Coprinopsis marcescibilis]
INNAVAYFIQEHGRLTMNCMLVASNAISSLIVLVLLDSAIEHRPRLLDLQPWRYLHKQHIQYSQTITTDHAIQVTRFPRDSECILDFTYTIMYSKESDHHRTLPPNLLLSHMAGRNTRVLGNILICKTTNSSYLVDLQPDDAVFMQQVLIAYAVDYGIEQNDGD